MTSFYADPGGVFDSDAHRRVAAHLDVPRSEASLRAAGDQGQVANGVRLADLSPDEIGALIDDLVSAGHVASVGSHDSAISLRKALKAPALVPVHADVANSPAITADGDEQFYLTKDGMNALTGPNANERPPLEGPALAAAEEFNRRYLERNRAYEEHGVARAKAVEEALAKVDAQHEEALAKADAEYEEGLR